MELPPVVEPVVTDDSPGGDLLPDVGRNEWELGLDLEHQEGSPALDPDVVVAVEFVTDLTHVAHDRRVRRAALPRGDRRDRDRRESSQSRTRRRLPRSEEHTSELQSRLHLVCRLLLEKKKKQ